LKSIVLFIGITSLMLSVDISLVRKQYKATVLSQVKTEILYTKLQKITKKDNKVLVAYKGAVTALFAKKQKGAKTKKEFFEKGVDLIEYAVKSNPNNIEIRFVRLTVQQNSPKFLKYNKQISADKNFLKTHFKAVKSKVLKKYILEYILQSKHFTKEEKNVFSQL